MPPRRNKAQEKQIATERVERLISLAEGAALAGRLADASRCVELAWRLTTRYVLETSPELKARRCRGCGAYLLAGESSRTRVTGGKLSTTCLACGRVRRVPFRREQRARRARTDRPDPAGGGSGAAATPAGAGQSF